LKEGAICYEKIQMPAKVGTRKRMDQLHYADNLSEQKKFEFNEYYPHSVFKNGR